MTFRVETTAEAEQDADAILFTSYIFDMDAACHSNSSYSFAFEDLAC